MALISIYIQQLSILFHITNPMIFFLHYRRAQNRNTPVVFRVRINIVLPVHQNLTQSRCHSQLPQRFYLPRLGCKADDEPSINFIVTLEFCRLIYSDTSLWTPVHSTRRYRVQVYEIPVRFALIHSVIFVWCIILAKLQFIVIAMLSLLFEKFAIILSSKSTIGWNSDCLYLCPQLYVDHCRLNLQLTLYSSMLNMTFHRSHSSSSRMQENIIAVKRKI